MPKYRNRFFIKSWIHLAYEKIDHYLINKLSIKIQKVNIPTFEFEPILFGKNAIYKSGTNPFYTFLPLKKGRISGQSLNFEDASHINLQALREAFKHESFNLQYQELKRCLKKHAKANQSTILNLNDSLNIREEPNKKLEKVPPWAKIYPWSHTQDINSVIDQANFSIKIENWKRGGPLLDGYNGGAQHPLQSSERAVFEAKLLMKLLKSFKNHGYKPKKVEPDPIGAILFKKSENEWFWQVSGGIHRCSVLAALGYENVPVLVKKVVYREDVESWPNVQNGLFSEKIALNVFDNML